MGSHSKKRKKDKKRSRSRSRSSERHKSRRKSRSPSRSRSRSPSYRSSKHKKHQKRSRSRSRSRSRERYSAPSHSRRSRSRSRDRASRRSSRSRSKDRSSRRSSRSRSRDRSSRRSSRSRSRERSSKHRRSRSRSSSRRSRSRTPEKRRRKRSRSKDRQRSRSPERSSRGESQERVKVKKEEAQIEDNSPLNPAEAIHQKMRKALEAAASADAKLREQGLLTGLKQEPLSRVDQLERDQALQNLETESFAPSTFVPSRERQVQPSYLTKEQTHENAIFGGVGVPNPALNGGGTYSYGIPMTYKKRGQLASKYLAESAETKENRWLIKLQRMRRQKLQANPNFFNKLLSINADSPTTRV